VKAGRGPVKGTGERNMATIRHTGDFYAILPKSGAAVVGLTYEPFQRHKMLCARVWERSTGSLDEYSNTDHGLNLSPWYFVYVCDDVEAMLKDDQFDPAGFDVGGKLLRFQRQVYCGKDLIVVRLHHQNKALGPRPSKNGLSLRPELWRELLPHIRQALDGLSY
jgi:hypothetical protein